MKIAHKAIPLDAIESSVHGLLWTTGGIQIVRPGDLVVTAPTGCTWRIKKRNKKLYWTTAK